MRRVVLRLAIWGSLGLACCGSWAATFSTSGSDVKPTKPEASRLEQVTDPLDWGGDFRLREEGSINAVTLDSSVPNNEASYVRARLRVWARAMPSDEVSFTARFMSEPRYYFQPQIREGWAYDEALFDLFHLSLTNLIDQPVAVTVGRQEFNFGDKWLIWDGVTTDGSRSEFFDAARFTFNLGEQGTTIDAIYVHQEAESESWLPVLHEVNPYVSEQKERAAILYVSNRSLPQTRLDAYAIFRHQEAVVSRGNSGDTWLVGGRIAGRLGENWDYHTEFAPEFGRLNGADLRAWGCQNQLGYRLGGTWDTRMRLGYEYLSGDDPATTANEGWDPMWGRRARWSEIMLLLFGAENRARAGDYKNLHRPSIGLTLHPTRRLEFSTDYAPLFADDNTYSGQAGYSRNGKFRGHYWQGILRYRHDEHWSALLWAELFQPGDYYSSQRRDLATFYRAEINVRF